MSVPKKFMLCFSLKTGAMIMVLGNFSIAAIALIWSAVQMYYNDSEELKLYVVTAIPMAIFNIASGIVLIIAMVQGKEKMVLVYILLEVINLIILTIFSVINMISHESLILSILFLVCLVMWFNLYSTYGFYQELADYNTVNAGAIQISYQGYTNDMVDLPEKAMESTAV